MRSPLALLLAALLAHAVLANPSAYLFKGRQGDTSQKVDVLLEPGEAEKEVYWTYPLGVELVGSAGNITEDNYNALNPSVDIDDDLGLVTFRRYRDLSGYAGASVTWNLDYVIPAHSVVPLRRKGARAPLRAGRARGAAAAAVQLPPRV